MPPLTTFWVLPPTLIASQKRQVSDKDVTALMIKYDRLWETMKLRGITQYDLYTHYGVNNSLLDRLRHNRNIEINTIDKLCNILSCHVEDIMEHVPDDNHF